MSNISKVSVIHSITNYHFLFVSRKKTNDKHVTYDRMMRSDARFLCELPVNIYYEQAVTFTFRPIAVAATLKITRG